MKLVKDLNDSGIVYYWLDDGGMRISPEIPCITLAEEWRIKYLFSTYKGGERRHSIIDRRQNQDKRIDLERTYFVSLMKPDGRRIADTPVKVDIDLVAEKIRSYC